MYQTQNDDAITLSIDGRNVATVTRIERQSDDEQWRRLVALVRHAPELLDAVDQCAASLENCVLHYGDQMCEADRASRGKNAAAARAAQARAEGFQCWDDALAAWCGE